MDYTTLKTNPSNPRRINKDQFERLKKSIGSFTKMLEIRPIAYDEDGVIWGGNMRYEALKALGIEMKPEYFKELKGFTLEEKREFAIRDNIELGEWDDDILANEWSDLPLDDWGIDTKGWEKEVEEDDVPEVSEEEPVSKLGEVYQLGRHRLMCGDSTKIEDVEKLMNGQKADMVFTDPPYLMGFEGNVHADGSKSFNAKYGAIDNDKMSREDGDEFIFNMFTSISTFNKGAYYVCFYRLGLDYIFRALDRHNNRYRALIIWDKGNHTLSNSDYMSRYEPIVYGWFKEHKFYGDRSNFDIWHIDRTAKNELHPTMKPVELCAYAVRNSSVEDNIVLDLFGGSGSTLIACEQLQRTCYMMEIDPKYCDVIRKRYWKLVNDSEEGWEVNTPAII